LTFWVHLYRKWGNAVQDDLFASLDVYAQSENLFPDDDDLTVKMIMDTWTRQTGYPLIRITKASDSLVYVSQVRFFLTLKKLACYFFLVNIKSSGLFLGTIWRCYSHDR